MDRNYNRLLDIAKTAVALRKESVDRNNTASLGDAWGMSSLSARRAWIEIRLPVISCSFCMSLSARRAWIEIGHRSIKILRFRVALRKESVDRNVPGL